MYFNRAIENHLRYLSQHFPVVVVTGARQIGKTTLMRQVFGGDTNVGYVTLDYPTLRESAQNDPELFLQQYPAPVIIDEIQYAPQLFPYIKIRIDKNRQNGQYFLTGSQMFHLMKGVGESLAGRVGTTMLYGLSRAEIEVRHENLFLPSNDMNVVSDETITDVFDKIYRGSMPQMIVDSELSPEIFYGSYVQTYMERDIRNLLEIKKESLFLKYIASVAARTGQELNLSDISKDVGIDVKTAESWLSLLVTSGLVFLLNPYSGNTIKRIIKRPKIYFMDTGLACYLSLWNNPRSLENSAMAGAMFETYAVSELVKTYTNKGLDVRSRFSYYRDNNGNEIDLIITENGINHPVEFKKNSQVGKEALKNFKVMDALNEKRGNGAVVCLSPVTYPLDEFNKAVPIAAV